MPVKLPIATAALCALFQLCISSALSAQSVGQSSELSGPPLKSPPTTTSARAFSDLAATLGPRVAKQWRRQNWIEVDVAAEDTDLQTSRQLIHRLFSEYEELRRDHVAAKRTGVGVALAGGFGARSLPLDCSYWPLPETKRWIVSPISVLDNCSRTASRRSCRLVV